MNLFRLIIRSLRHYFATNMATAAGIAVATAVLCGALIVGDSLKGSLVRIVDNRLGEATHTITAGERIFTIAFGRKMDGFDGLTAAPVLKSEGAITVQGTGQRTGKVQVWGVDSMFTEVTGMDPGLVGMDPGLPRMSPEEAILSENLAARMDLDTGDYFMLRVRVTGPIPPNTPFVSDQEQTVTRRVKVSGIAGREAAGHFNLQVSQSAPFNLFVPLEWLNGIMGLDAMANLLVVRDVEGPASSRIAGRVQQSWQVEDGGLHMEYTSDAGAWKITSSRVFLDHYLSDGLAESFPGEERALTYFVNGIGFSGRETPYSFVAALDRSEFEPGRNEVLINQWLAEDLGAGKGDTLQMRYFEVGPLRELEEKQAWFVVSGIIPMEEAQKDAYLMPELPGLSDAGSCSDWETGIPIELDAIRQKDEDYWDAFRGTPKAYVSLERGMELWQNRFGNLTSVLIEGNESDSLQLREAMAGRFDPTRLEFQVNPVRQKGLEAARGGVDFSQLFAGLGMFIVLAGLMLTALLLGFGIQRRKDQLQLFTSLGFPEKLIRKALGAEAALVTLVGAGIGLILALGYSRLVFVGLNRIWQDIVRTEVLEMHVNPGTMAVGLAAGVGLGLAVVAWKIRSMTASGVASARTVPKTTKTFTLRPGPKRIRQLSVLLGAASVLLAGYLFLQNDFSSVLAWFAAGGLLLLSMLGMAWALLQAQPKPGRETSDLSKFVLDLNRLSLKNTRRNPVRSFTIIALLAMGSFVLVVTAANRKDLAADAFSPRGGTGGFWFMAETTSPVLRNLNRPDPRLELGIPDGANFVQFHSTYDDDASCLNLNRVENPRILATDPALLKDRFSFVAAITDEGDPWQLLERQMEGVVPAIADQSVIRWGLGKRPGDTLTYLNASGEEIRLLLVGGLANSIFQGNVIISERQFLKHFPARAGTNVFLVEGSGPLEGQTALAEELDLIFRDQGWEMARASEKLAEFNTVENTYLAIFFLMGAFGMLLGTIGLAVILAKSMLERKSETALLKALGYPSPTLIRLFATEYLLLLVSGILAGALPALLATMPPLLEGSQNVPAGFLAGVLGLLLVNGAFWILLITQHGIRRQEVLQSLRND
jgi:putative ABC transport system permease protein